jgi:hypothetical protein
MKGIEVEGEKQKLGFPGGDCRLLVVEITTFSSSLIAVEEDQGGLTQHTPFILVA